MDRVLSARAGVREQANPARFLRALASLALLLALAMAQAAYAQDDLPGRVGRLADAAGGVYVAPAEAAADWAEVGVNYSVISGDNLWASPGGRAEVDYGGGQFRLAGATSVHISRLDDRQLALFIAEGSLIIRVRVLDPGDVARIDAPTAQVQLARPGLYRIDVVPDQQTTTITVREGEAFVSVPAGITQALPGQAVAVIGQDPAVAELQGSVGVDGFDVWSADRDRYYERSRSNAYASKQMIGVADLDRYGAWQTYPDYGAVWFPNAVAYDWAPYRDGYWVNVGPYGATWVDAAPWGYAPFHYGRWAFIGGRWGWCPGGYVARPIWAPALVVWQGGPAWGVSVSYGAPVYGWVPLGWRDPYIPWWNNCSARCWSLYNQPYGVAYRERPQVVPATFANQTVPGALTAVPAHALNGTRSMALDRVRVPVQSAAAAPIYHPPQMPPVRARTPASTAGAVRPPIAASIDASRNRRVYSVPSVPASARSSLANAAASAGGTTTAAPRAATPRQASPTPGAYGRPAPSRNAAGETPAARSETTRPDPRSYPSRAVAPAPAGAPQAVPATATGTAVAPARSATPRDERSAPVPAARVQVAPPPRGVPVVPAPAATQGVAAPPPPVVVQPATPAHQGPRGAPVVKDSAPSNDAAAPAPQPSAPYGARGPGGR